ncbi:MAG: energy-coupling factor transporter ATPase [Lachnospiraceae bacterium]|nr:energy-coupling factor transporter ATPase [Lachnospiraceae bacterium]
MSLILDHVSFIYGQGTGEEKKALDDISLEIREQEMIALIGHTGSGKSTLVQLFNGLEMPTMGTVYFNGRDISEKDFSKRELRGKVGLVFQYPEYQLFEESVIKDVQFGPKNMGFRQLDVEMYSFQALKDVGIGDDLLDASPLMLSGGQKRRVAIAGVLAMQPEILVLDEPMAGLDPAGRKEILNLLKKLHQEKKMTVFFISHNMEEVAETAERVLVMHQGKIVLDGTPEKIFQYEAELEKIGLGVPQTASFAKRLEKKGWRFSKNPVTTDQMVAEIMGRWNGGKHDS